MEEEGEREARLTKGKADRLMLLLLQVLLLLLLLLHLMLLLLLLLLLQLMLDLCLHLCLLHSLLLLLLHEELLLLHLHKLRGMHTELRRLSLHLCLHGLLMRVLSRLLLSRCDHLRVHLHLLRPFLVDFHTRHFRDGLHDGVQGLTNLRIDARRLHLLKTRLVIVLQARNFIQLHQIKIHIAI